MDSDCIKVDLENDSTQNDEVESMDAQDIKDNDDNNVAAKRKRKDRSIVWNYFTKLNQPSIGGKLQCKCNKCKHVFTYDSKTGTVSNEVNCNELTEDIMFLDISHESGLNFEVEEMNMKRRTNGLIVFDECVA
ncbi:hypothetical protein E3N88_14958 [Mikania micrantha]|uniref:BED-type domain-containing protein n=1 Tax=Mikania micrantha TaxID=192012 RepID=A0A5N6P4C0_9ASTR|nr:hypothetical protein E3N88_14958 [Mikania micrantha]